MSVAPNRPWIFHHKQSILGVPSFMEPPNVSKRIPHDMVNFGTGRNQHHTDATFISRHIYL